MSFRDKIVFFFISYLASFIIRFLHLTMRFKYFNREKMEELIKSGKNYIIAFWHGQLLMMPYSYFGKKIHILISQHKDGEYVSQTMKRFGFFSVRGSTTRGSLSLVRKSVKLAKSGSDIAITPDGPRGPRQKAQMGVIELAKLTSLPILPVAFGVSKKKFLSSWDRMLIPSPFSRGVFIYGNLIHISRNSSFDQMEEKRQVLEEELNRLTDLIETKFQE